MIQALSPHTPRGSLLLALALVTAASPADGATGRRQDTQARTALEVLVLDRDGEPVFGLTERDFVVTRNGANYAVTGVEEQAAGEAPRRFVFVFNRRGADASQLSRALRGLKAFIEESLLDSDESLFADLGETLRIGRAFGPGRGVALAGLETIPAMGYRSPAGTEDDAAVTARMLELVAERLTAAPGRKILVMFSGSLSSFSWTAEQPGTIRKADLPRIRSDPRGQLDAGLTPIARRLGAAQATVHVLHLAGVQELEDRILTADRGELIVNDTRVSGNIFSSTTREGRQLAASPRSADDILSSFAAESGGLYFARATGFRKPLDRIAARNERWYRLSLVGEDAAAERQSGVPQVLVPGCSDCTVLPATNPE